MITLILLRPLQSTPVQQWTFEDKSVIRIGRATDNNVVLYSAVVSRRHVEIRHVGKSWEIVNLGANGTYVDSQRISHVPVVDGMIVRLARSGPQIQIRLKSTTPETRQSQKRSPVPLKRSEDSLVSAPEPLDDDVEDTTSPDLRSKSVVHYPPVRAHTCASP